MPHKRYHPGFVRRETANIYDKPLAERTTGVTNREALSFSIGALVARSLVGGITKKSLGAEAYNWVSSMFKKQSSTTPSPTRTTTTWPNKNPKGPIRKAGQTAVRKADQDVAAKGYSKWFKGKLKETGQEDKIKSPKEEKFWDQKTKKEWKRAKQTAGKRRGGGFDEDPIPQPQTTWGKIASMVFSPRSFPGGIVNLYHTASSFSSSEKLGGKKPSPVWRNPR